MADIDGVKLPVSPTFNAPSELAQAVAGKQYSAVVFITDDNVAAAHLPRYQSALPHAISIIIRPGEDSKTLSQAENVYRQLLQLNIGRDALIIAIGGGLVTDFGAFIAATYKRGIDFMLVSTSLLGCVDAVVGGKESDLPGSCRIGDTARTTYPRRARGSLQDRTCLPSQSRAIHRRKSGTTGQRRLAAHRESRRGVRPGEGGGRPSGLP